MMNRFHRLALFLLGAMSLPTAWLPAGAQVNAEQVIAIGRNVMSMEDYALAIQYFNLAIGAKPYLADPYFLRALAKLNLDDFRGAERDCTMALERNKFKTEAYKLRGFARQQLGLDSLAVEDYDTGLLDNPYDKYFLYYKAVAQTSAGRHAAADSTFTLLLRGNPDFDEGYSARARLELLRGDTLRAEADADRAIRLNRTQPAPWLLKAQIEADRENWGAALASMDEALLIRPDEEDLYVNRAYLRYNDNDFTGAMEDYNRALELHPSYLPALFNRALLRTEVRDLINAEKDFSAVLEQEPDNFHALYNRGVVRLEQGRNAEALRDFNRIAAQYPRFYPVYYAIAEAHRQAGNLRKTAENIKKADSMVSAYVADPKRNPLDRPAIASGATRREDSHKNPEESPEEVMEEFNRLITVSPEGQAELAFNERIKGRVQDRTVPADPEAAFTLSPLVPDVSLRSGADSFRELAQFNDGHYIERRLYLAPQSRTLTDEEFKELSSIAADLRRPARGELRPADHVLLGSVYSSLKNYREANSEFTAALASDPRMAVALLGRGAALAGQAKTAQGEERGALLNAAAADIDAALTQNRTNPYLWFNKGNVLYAAREFDGALACFQEAARLDPSLGPAWFNSALALLQTGRKREALQSLSKAGELGVLQAYNLLKRLS